MTRCNTEVFFYLLLYCFVLCSTCGRPKCGIKHKQCASTNFFEKALFRHDAGQNRSSSNFISKNFLNIYPFHISQKKLFEISVLEI